MHRPTGRRGCCRALGTAAQLRLPWPECWDEVLRANRAKVPGVGKRGMAMDLIKPPGWRAPDHGPILRAHGYVAEAPASTDGAAPQSWRGWKGI